MSADQDQTVMLRDARIEELESLLADVTEELRMTEVQRDGLICETCPTPGQCGLTVRPLCQFTSLALRVALERIAYEKEREPVKGTTGVSGKPRYIHELRSRAIAIAALDQP